MNSRFRFVARELLDVGKSLRFAPESYRQALGYEKMCMERYKKHGWIPHEDWKPTRFLPLSLAVGELAQICAVIKCAFAGHDLEDHSYGGPEHGNMDHSCKRCGRYWSVPLY